jgi:hypothetical protein
MDENFSNGQVAFFQQNADKFTDDEENKLEYTVIHEEYIYIIDEAIESKLREDFSQEAIDSFYANFKEEFETLRKVNPDAVDILFCAINFPAFKEQMLKFKSSHDSKDQGKINEDNTNLTGTDGEKYFWDLYAEDKTKAPWRLGLNNDNKKEKYSIKAYQRPCDTPVDVIRMDIRLKGINKEDWFETLKMGPPIKAAKSRKIVKELGENHRIIHLIISPPIIADREAVLDWKRTEINDKESLLCIQSTLLDEVPIKEKILRLQLYKCQVIRQCEENPEDLLVTDISNFDMKGSIPTRLMNMALCTMMSKGITELNKAVR